MSKNYVLRVRQPDGSWKFYMDNPMPLREAKRNEKINRIIGGTLCQIWPEEEAQSIVSKEPAP